jgi:hypothetical protein
MQPIYYTALPTLWSCGSIEGEIFSAVKLETFSKAKTGHHSNVNHVVSCPLINQTSQGESHISCILPGELCVMTCHWLHKSHKSVYISTKYYSVMCKVYMAWERKHHLPEERPCHKTMRHFICNIKFVSLLLGCFSLTFSIVTYLWHSLDRLSAYFTMHNTC